MSARHLGAAGVIALFLGACAGATEETATVPDTVAGNAGTTIVTDRVTEGTSGTVEEDIVEDPIGSVEQRAVDIVDEPDDVADDGADGTFTAGACPFEIEVDVEVDCGTVTVPESREGLSDATIELAVAILRTPSENPAPDPVVYLEGGPGGAALSTHASWIGGLDEWPFHAVLSTRDMILVDPRGTGYSVPSLACGDDEEEAVCFQRLIDEGITVPAYSTPENAADIAAIRVALGYEEWNLFGSSYGTRVALVTLDDHPEGIRSLLLAGVYPPDKVPAYHDYMANSLRAIDELSAECLRQSACDTTYGRIRDLLTDALRVTEEGPSEYGAEALFDALFQALYDTPGVAAAPLALQLAAEGSIDEALELLGGEEGGFQADATPRGSSWSVDPGDDSSGIFHTVECREEQVFTDLDVLEAQAAELIESGVDELLVTVLFSGALADTETVCPIWDSGRATDQERLPTMSDVPALVLSGEFDPITPPAWGDLAAASLSASTHVVVPTLSHSLVNRDQCVDDIIIEFFEDPTTELSTGCLDDMTTLPFLMP